jgi:hypothetical protein
MSNLDYIQFVISAEFGGPLVAGVPAALAPSEREALERWSSRLARVRSGDNELALPSGALVWA